MSAQEFKPGDRVRTHNGVGTVRSPNAPATVEYDDGGWDSLSNPRIIASICRLDEPTEPEDKDDLYVEPEPLRESQWVQVWAQVDHVRDGGRVALFFERETHAFIDYADVYPDAIVCPAAGQVPPWVQSATVKPEEPDVLGAVVYSDSNGKFWTRASIDPEESHVWAGAYDKCWFNWRQLPDDVVVWDPADPARGGAS